MNAKTILILIALAVAALGPVVSPATAIAATNTETAGKTLYTCCLLYTSLRLHGQFAHARKRRVDLLQVTVLGLAERRGVRNVVRSRMHPAQFGG